MVSLHGCWQPSGLCKTTKPLPWRLTAYRNAPSLHSNRKPRRVFTAQSLRRCDQRLRFPFCACRALSAQLIRTIMPKCHSMLCNRSHRRASSWVYALALLTTTISWLSSLSNAGAAFIKQDEKARAARSGRGFVAQVNMVLSTLLQHLYAHNTQLIYIPHCACTYWELVY